MDLSGISLNFLINLVATIVGIIIVLWLERQRRPSLYMRVGTSGKLTADDPLGREQATWTHVEIHNRSIPRWIGWVYDREPALNCRAWISFHHLDGYRIYDREMIARWSETLEPTVEVQETKTEQKYAAKLLNVQLTVDIPPGEYTTIDVVSKIKGEDECYGWNNESYLHNWRHPGWKLGRGRYIAKVRVKTGGREYIDAFMIVNDVPYEDFRLEPIDEEMKKRLK